MCLTALHPISGRFNSEERRCIVHTHSGDSTPRELILFNPSNRSAGLTVPQNVLRQSLTTDKRPHRVRLPVTYSHSKNVLVVIEDGHRWFPLRHGSQTHLALMPASNDSMVFQNGWCSSLSRWACARVFSASFLLPICSSHPASVSNPSIAAFHKLNLQ